MTKNSIFAIALVGLMSTAASAADLYVQEAATPKWDSFFEAYGGYHWTELSATEDSASFDAGVFGGRASGSYKWESGFGIQTDLTANRQYLGDPLGGNCVDIECIFIGGEWNTTDVDAALHLYHQGDNFLIGAIGQYGYTDLSIGILSVDWNRLYGGVEAQAYFGNWTLYGRVGYEKIDLFEEFSGLNGFIPADALDSDGVSVMAEARYYLTDNTKFSGSVTYLARSFDEEFGDVNTWTIGGKAEHRFTEIPFSVFASVDWSLTDFEDSGPIDLEDEKVTFLAGVKLNLGSDSLIDRDRNGATLDPFSNPKPVVDLIRGEGFIGSITPPEPQ